MASWPYSTARWQKLRIVKLSAKPLCEDCEARGLLVPARAVDHIKSIRSGGAPFPALDELKSLCFSCHNRKTALYDRPTLKGCDAEGNPLNAEGGWFAKGGPSNHQKGLAGTVTSEEARILNLKNEDEKWD